MSVTVTCKRIASAFRGPDGEAVYILHEVTYESNVYPHSKCIYPICVGNISDCMKAIFFHAGVTEGGSLNSPDRRMTPERYIKSWLNALKHPYLMDQDSPLSLTGVYSWNKDKLESLKACIHEKGLPPTIGNYFRDVQALRAYFAVPVYFTDDGTPMMDMELAEDLAYNPKTVKKSPVEALKHQVFAIHDRDGLDESYLLLDDSGQNLNRPEWSYRVVGDFVANLWRNELALPGSYKAEIPAFRERLKNTQPTTNLRCFLEPDDDRYNANTIKTLKAKYGDGFHLSAVDKEDMYDVLRCVETYQAA